MCDNSPNSIKDSSHNNYQISKRKLILGSPDLLLLNKIEILILGLQGNT
jgi:hypothetical protein